MHRPITANLDLSDHELPTTLSLSPAKIAPLLVTHPARRKAPRPAERLVQKRAHPAKLPGVQLEQAHDRDKAAVLRVLLAGREGCQSCRERHVEETGGRGIDGGEAGTAHGVGPALEAVENTCEEYCFSCEALQQARERPGIQTYLA